MVGRARYPPLVSVPPAAGLQPRASLLPWRCRIPQDLEGTQACTTWQRPSIEEWGIRLLTVVQSLRRVHSLWPHGLQHARPPCPSLSPEFAQTHVHWVGDAIQPSHSLSPPSPPALNLSQHQGFFQSGGQSTGALASASVLPMNIQGWFPLGLTSWISLQSKGLSRVFSSTTVQKHQFFGAQPSLWYNSHLCTWLLEKP